MKTERIRVEDPREMPFPDESFTGNWVVEWPNGQMKYEGHFRCGVHEGIHRCGWENGRIAQIGAYEAGVAVGIWTDFHPSGVRYKACHYFAEGSVDVMWLDADGKVLRTEKYRNGKEA